MSEDYALTNAEVSELVAWLRAWARGTLEEGQPATSRSLTRAADLLEQRQAEIECERMRLAVCGVVAMSDTVETLARARDCHPNYWSASSDDVARRVDELMRLREWCQSSPVLVIERLPGADDCDAEGRCWCFDPAADPGTTDGVPSWEFCHWEMEHTHWLPASTKYLPAMLG